MKQSSKKPTGSALVLAVLLVMAVSASLEENPAPPFESAHPDCSDGVDNDFDGLIDLDDPDCTNENNPFGGESPPNTSP